MGVLVGAWRYVSVAQRRSLGWRKKVLSYRIIEAVSEVDQEQRLELEEIGAKTGNLGNRADRMCRNAETWRVLRRNHSRAKKQTRGDSCPERPGRGTAVPQDRERDPGSRVLRIRQVGRRPRPPVLL